MRFYLSLLATSIRASIALRGAFLLEFTLLIANNFIFMSMWWIFFTKFRAIGDWQLQDIIALFAIGGGAYGLMQVCFGGTKQLTKMIQSGDLDTYLTQPKNVLLQIAGSKSATKGWGHLMTTLILIVLGGLTEPKTLALILLSMCTGCLIFASIRIIAHSLAFWLGPVEALSEKYADSLYLFALYPSNIYSGLMQVFMFTVIPAAAITYLPVELIREFNWTKLFVLIVVSLVFPIIAFWVFGRGLKRYESGNQMSLRI